MNLICESYHKRKRTKHHLIVLWIGLIITHVCYGGCISHFFVIFYFDLYFDE